MKKLLALILITGTSFAYAQSLQPITQSQVKSKDPYQVYGLSLRCVALFWFLNDSIKSESTRELVKLSVQVSKDIGDYQGYSVEKVRDASWVFIEFTKPIYTAEIKKTKSPLIQNDMFMCSDLLQRFK